MAVDINKLSLSRVLNKAREIFTPIAQRNIPLVQSMNMASRAVNTPLNVNLEPFRGAYNSVNRALKQPVGQFGQSIINTSNKLVNSPLGIPGRAVMGYGDSLRENITRAGQAYEQNTQLLNEGAPLKARVKPLAMGGWNTAKALAQVTPVGALKPTVGMALPGLLNAGIAKYQGQDPARAFGRGVAEYQGWRPILNVTDPAISKVANKVSAGGRGLSRLGKLSPQQLVTSQVATRGATGIGNVIEDEILARLDQRKITNKDRAFSFGMGAAMGGNQELLKQADFTDIAKKLKVPVKQVQEVYENSLGRKITVTDKNGKTSVGITDKRGSGEWIKWATDNGYDYKIELTGGSLGSVGGGQKPPDPLEALKVEARTPQDLASEALKKVGQDPKDAYLTSAQLKKKYAINEDVLLEKKLADINERINTFSKLGDTKSNKMVLDRLFKEYSEVSEKLRPSPKPQSQLPKSGVELKPKTKLLQQAEQLKNAGIEQLSANQELAQMNQVKRSMFTDNQIKDINRLKTIARSKKAQEGDIETLRSLTPDGLTDRVLEYVEQATAVKGQGNEEQLLEMALSIPTKADTKVKLPDEIKQARELEKQASKLRDLVYNSETDPNIKTKVVADNQEIIRESALSDYKEWEKQLFKQESAKRMTPNRQAGRVALQIKTNTKPSYARPENIANTQDISNMGKGMTDIYRNVDRVFGKNSQVRKQILEPFDTAKTNMVDDLEREATDLEKNIISKYGFKKGSTESEYIQKYGEGLVNDSELIGKFGKAKAKQIIEADKWFRSQYDRLLGEVNAVREKIYPNDPSKIIPRRKDYYRHFQDLSSMFAGLKNLFDNPAGIEPGLAGVSEYVKPKSKWLSFAQKRLGMRTEYDAIGGYLDYVGAQTYAKRIDPFIEKFRELRQELVDATSIEGDKNYGKLNNFIEFLDDYANDLAGKTNPADRVAQKYIGRKAFSILNWINSRTKANVIVGNLSSSIAQFFNIPQGLAEAGLGNSTKGMARTLGSILDNTDTPITKSEFIKTRFAGDISDRFDVGILSNVKKAASWITGIGDEIGTKLIWNSIYEKALEQNIDNPIKYADDITRKMVAGRGIGEVPLLQKSKVFQLVAPFQLEVSNVWHVMREWAGEKAANKFVTFFIASYLMNRVAEKIRGSDVSIDPIQTGIDAIEAYGEEDDKKIGVLRAGGRVFGEILSNVPGGQTIAAMYPEYGTTIGDTKLPIRKSLFGEGDPTRFGGGLLASKGLSDPLYKIIPPFGGAQIKKTIEGLGVVNKGYSESKTGRVRFPIEQSPLRYLQAGAFGQYSVPEARAYFKNKGSVMGEKQSATFKSLIQTQGPEQAKSFYNSILSNRGKGGVVDTEGEPSSDLSVIQSKLDNSPQLLTSDEIATYYESKVTQPKSTSAYENAVYENDIWKQVSNINSRESLTQIQKDEASMSLLSKIGVTPEDYKYHVVAKQDNDIKSLYAEEEITKLMASGVSREEIDQWLVDNRKEVDGKQILTSGVIDYLVDQNILSYSQGKDLKSIKVSGSGTKKSVTKKSGKTKKPKKISFKAIKPPKVKIVRSVASSYFKAPKIKRVRIKKAKKLTFR